MRIVSGLAFGLGALLLGSFAGALHPVGDALAVLRLPLAAGFALAVIWTGWIWWLRWGLAGLGMALMGPFVWPGLGAPPVPQGAADLTLYQQNLLWNRREDAAFRGELARRLPDVVTLQEVSAGNLALLERLRAVYPHQARCLTSPQFGEVVLSRLPVVAGSARCSTRDGFAALQVRTAGGAVWVVSAHLNWPWPFDQAGQVAQILPFLTALEGPVVVAGDFNTVAQAAVLRRMERASGTRRAGPRQATFRIGAWVPLGIDHVLAPGGAARVEVLPPHGSDHHGLFAEIVLP